MKKYRYPEYRKQYKASAEGKAVDLAWRQSLRGRISVRNSRLKRVYGITSEDFSVLLGEQMCLCKSCKIPLSLTSGRADSCHTDHNHETGVVRGLLCQACNLTAGAARENIERLHAVANYLQKAG